MNTPQNTIPLEHAKNYILAGKAHVGFYSSKSGDTYWFRVKKSKKDENRWNVYMDYTVTEQELFLGYIKLVYGTETTHLFYAPGTDITDSWSSNKLHYLFVFATTWDYIQYQKEKTHLFILHDGHCSYCMRKLTDGLSLTIGIGPACRKKLGI